MSRKPYIKEPIASYIVARYDLGEKVEVIAATFGVHRSTVQRLVKRKGATRRPIGGGFKCP